MTSVVILQTPQTLPHFLERILPKDSKIQLQSMLRLTIHLVICNWRRTLYTLAQQNKKSELLTTQSPENHMKLFGISR